jgi:hypothetical protein
MPGSAFLAITSRCKAAGLEALAFLAKAGRRLTGT